jgi:hypothetical protein
VTKLLVNIEINLNWLIAFLHQFQITICSGFENKFSVDLLDSFFAKILVESFKSIGYKLNADPCCKVKPQGI